MVTFVPSCISNRALGDIGDLSHTLLIHHVPSLQLHSCMLSLICFMEHKWLLPGSLTRCILLPAAFFSIPVLI